MNLFSENLEDVRQDHRESTLKAIHEGIHN